jgi:hypothetical protein
MEIHMLITIFSISQTSTGDRHAALATAAAEA